MSSNRDLLDRAVAVYNAGDLDGYVDLYADDAVLTTPEGVFTGRSDIRDRFARELTALSDVEFSCSATSRVRPSSPTSSSSPAPTPDR